MIIWEMEWEEEYPGWGRANDDAGGAGNIFKAAGYCNEEEEYDEDSAFHRDARLIENYCKYGSHTSTGFDAVRDDWWCWANRLGGLW